MVSSLRLVQSTGLENTFVPAEKQARRPMPVRAGIRRRRRLSSAVPMRISFFNRRADNESLDTPILVYPNCRQTMRNFCVKIIHRGLFFYFRLP